VATTAAVEPTLPVEATAPACESCLTLKLSTPVLAALVAVAVTFELDEVAVITVQSAGRLIADAAVPRLANAVFRLW
jgi:hypothetical protein